MLHKHLKLCIMLSVYYACLHMCLHLRNITLEYLSMRELPDNTTHSVNQRFADRTVQHMKNDSVNVLGYTIRFIYASRAVCSLAQDSEALQPSILLVLVHSSVNNRPNRDAIRNTWSGRQYGREDNLPVSTVFLVGRSLVCTEMEKLSHESAAFQDIVILDTVDTYLNLSIKSLAGLHWARQRCGHVPYVLKVDDDVYLNLGYLMHSIDTDPMFRQHGLLGARNDNAKVSRRGIWALTRDQHMSDYFPPYCSGNGYLMNQTVLWGIIDASEHILMSDTHISPEVDLYGDSEYATDSHSAHHLTYVPLEDVLITGYLARAAGVLCRNHRKFPNWIVGPSSANILALKHGKLFALHNVHYKKMYAIHKDVHHNSNNMR